MLIELGTKQDIDNWMSLVEKVKDVFPGLATKEAMDEHKNTVLEFMGRASAICAKEQGIIVGTLLFSSANNEICFLAVDAEHRRQHIAEKMVSFMLTKINPLQDISVTTYRDEVPEGRAARAFYKQMGFTEGKLTEEFGSPVQEFVLKR